MIKSEMWWLIGSAPDFLGRAEVPGSNPESPTMILGAAGTLCNTVNSRGRGGYLHLRPKKYTKINKNYTDNNKKGGKR